ncbi:hypothetical protein ERUR111494_09065 [Erysipelothrix urinaevulpis]|uniref:hypothetical protein n=1 Tax=Erysipelothrix urinaevulpis TaxID=2683717 RepID=UPI001358DC03|nr:hypothetical protein [Erysipelothrix urinaevulpis]
MKEFLERFSEAGIKVDLDNLSRFDDGKYEGLLQVLVNPKTKESCDVNNTKAIIHPHAPFGKKDYKIDVELDCGLATVE